MDEKKNKILYVIVAIVGILMLIYLIISTKNIIDGYRKKDTKKEVITENNIKDNLYIGIWKECSEIDFDIYSKGEDNVYTGAKPYQYIITKKGNLYEYQDKMFVKDSAKVNYLKKLSDDDLKKFEDEIQSIVDNYNSTIEKEEILKGNGWIIHYKDNEIRVKYEVVKPILEKYLAGIKIKSIF